MKPLSDHTLDDLRRNLRYTSPPPGRDVTWAICAACGVNGASGSAYCAECIRREMERRGKGGAT